MANLSFELVEDGEMFRRASILALALTAVMVELDAGTKSLLLAALADFRDHFAAAGCPQLAESTEWCIRTYVTPVEELRARRVEASGTDAGSK